MIRQDETIKNPKFENKICEYTNNLLYLRNLKQLGDDKSTFRVHKKDS